MSELERPPKLPTEKPRSAKLLALLKPSSPVLMLIGLPDTPVKLGDLPSVEGRAGKCAGSAIIRTVP